MTGGPQNVMGYSNPQVDQLFEQAAVELDETKRQQAYGEIQALVVHDLPAYYMLTTKSPTAFDKRVGGVTPSQGSHLLRQNNLQVLDWYVSRE
jgi:peptide/nickel transport system substrate-binding protein